MARNARASRLDISYLASRHAGVFFFLVALGIACGWLWRSLAEPTSHASRASLSVVARPPFDWDERVRQWQALPRDPEEARLLDINLRHVVKLAVAGEAITDPDRLAPMLRLLPSRVYSAALLPNPPAERFGPMLSLAVDDIAANLDFQSLAKIVSDLGAPTGAAGWDFSFFHAQPRRTLREAMISRPEENDPFFKVFYHLYRLRNGGASPASPEEAWRGAVEELRDRLERETLLAGEGGFGPIAKRELLREIDAIPALFANGLYSAGWQRNANGAQAAMWRKRWNENFSLALARQGANGGTLSADARICLYPLAFPRDTRLTRIAPLIAETALAYLAARDGVRIPEAVSPPPPSAEALDIADGAKAAAPTIGEPPPGQEPDAAPDAAARVPRRNLEKQIADAKLAQQNALRLLNTSKTREASLVREALAARARADFLKDGYEAMVAAGSPEPIVETPVEAMRLLLERDAIRERLAVFRQTRTDEHPFVRQARRELDAVESLLGQYDLAKTDNGAATAWETRRRNLHMEWEAAECAARNIEERRRRIEGEIGKALFDAAAAERILSEAGAELAALANQLRPPASSAAKIEPVRETPAPQPAPQVRNAAKIAEEPSAPAFSRLSAIAVLRTPPSWKALPVGGLVGLILAFAWMLARELFASRFATASEARRLVDLPLLAALPAYDGNSFLAAAKTMRGDVVARRGGERVFVPSQIDVEPPPPVGRRGKLTPRRTASGQLGVCLGLGLGALTLAAAVHFLALRGIAPPPADFGGEPAMTTPIPHTRMPVGAIDENWGEQP